MSKDGMWNMCNLDFPKSIYLCSSVWEPAIQEYFKDGVVVRSSDLLLYCTYGEILQKLSVRECDFGAFQLWATATKV